MFIEYLSDRYIKYHIFYCRFNIRYNLYGNYNIIFLTYLMRDNLNLIKRLSSEVKVIYD